MKPQGKPHHPRKRDKKVHPRPATTGLWPARTKVTSLERLNVRISIETQ